MNRGAITCRSFQIELLLGTACLVLCNELTVGGGELQPEAHHGFCGRWEIGFLESVDEQSNAMTATR